MKVVITGSTGFVGRNLLQYFSNTIEFQILSRNDLQSFSQSLLNQTDVIIHLAGKAHDLKKNSDPDEYYQVNFGLTKKLYDAFLASNAKKFIFISSVKAVADSVEDILTEEDIPDPHTHYGKSKLMAEDYIQRQPLPPDKSYFILRPCMIHGPGNKGNLNLLYQFVKKRIPYPLAGFNNRRSFLSVENLCFVIHELIARKDIAGGIYQVADDEALSTITVVSLLASSLNVKFRMWSVPKNTIRFLAKAGDYLHLPLTTEKLDKLTESYVVSNQKIKLAVNKEFPLTAIEGLKITAKSWI